MDMTGYLQTDWDVASRRMLLWQSARNALEDERTWDDIDARVSRVGVSSVMKKYYFYIITSLAVIIWL
jgi:hypothetical protein